MSMDKQTSDERLLKLIEGAGQEKRKAPSGLGEKKPLIHQVGIKFNLSDLKAKLKDLKINLFLLNKGLIALAALLTLMFLFTIFTAPRVSKSNAVFFSSTDASSVMKLISGADTQGEAQKIISLQDFKRNFFLPSGSKVSAYVQQELAADITDELKDLKLVGIIWGSNPEVMIENAKTARTYTLKKGDSLDESFKIKEISRSSATLEVTTEEGSKQFVLR